MILSSPCFVSYLYFTFQIFCLYAWPLNILLPKSLILTSLILCFGSLLCSFCTLALDSLIHPYDFRLVLLCDEFPWTLPNRTDSDLMVSWLNFKFSIVLNDAYLPILHPFPSYSHHLSDFNLPFFCIPNPGYFSIIHWVAQNGNVIVIFESILPPFTIPSVTKSYKLYFFNDVLSFISIVSLPLHPCSHLFISVHCHVSPFYHFLYY